MTTVAVVIPAYQPGEALIHIVNALVASPLPAIVVVDDGSGPEYARIFDRISRHAKVTLIRHAVNLGKGAALKTGIGSVLRDFGEAVGVVTADADGQHDPQDILNVCARFEESPDALVMGARSFRGRIPFRSKLGNLITSAVMRVAMGQNLTDTQTGLRAVPRSLLGRLLKIPATGYEFELEMLIVARHMGLRVVEQPIRTIYEPGNPKSHFQPLRDSMRIYFVLLRFSFIAMLTAALDNLLFCGMFAWTGSLVRAQIVARLMAGFFNYTAVRRIAFLSEERHAVVLPRYLLLLAANTMVSYAAIRFLSDQFQVGVFSAKILAESLLFLANFAIQRDVVFSGRGGGGETATDWDRYYRAVPLTARLTRRYTRSVLIRVLRRFAASQGHLETIVEIGGANSCFLDGIVSAFHPDAYHVIDRNEYGLALLKRRLGGQRNVVLHRGDVLALPEMAWRADVVFSVGLIEHFDPPGTCKAIAAHFDVLRPGGYAIISFPTPTWLYSAARAVSETCDLWRFPDERPLRREEVLVALEGLGEVVFEKTLWPLIFTQHMVAVRKS